MIPRPLQMNRPLLTLVFAMLPAQFVLLRFGEPHGLTDQIGVVLTLIQWWILYASIGPARQVSSLSRGVFVRSGRG